MPIGIVWQLQTITDTATVAIKSEVCTVFRTNRAGNVASVGAFFGAVALLGCPDYTVDLTNSASFFEIK